MGFDPSVDITFGFLDRSFVSEFKDIRLGIFLVGSSYNFFSV
jgi:hypothetical protein